MNLKEKLDILKDRKNQLTKKLLINNEIHYSKVVARVRDHQATKELEEINRMIGILEDEIYLREITKESGDDEGQSAGQPVK